MKTLTPGTLPEFNHKLFLFAVFFLVIGVRLVIIDGFSVQLPLSDDWVMGEFLLHSLTDGVTVTDLIASSNEHRMSFNKILSLIAFKLNHHQWDPQIMMVINSIIWATALVILLIIIIKNGDLASPTGAVAFLIFLFVAPFSLININWGSQTHIYSLILFSILGCWLVNYPPFSRKWFGGMASLLAAPFTLAGGAFVALAVALCQVVWFVADRDQGKQYLLTMIFALVIAVFGFSLMLSHHGISHQASENFVVAVTTFFHSLSWPATNYAWPVVIFTAPLFLRLLQILRSNKPPSKIDKFALSLGLFLVLLVTDFARGPEGLNPDRRYIEFLSLFSFCSLVCLYRLSPPATRFGGAMQLTIRVLWIAVFIASLPWLHQTLVSGINDKHTQIEHHATTVNDFLNTGSITSFTDNTPSPTPFHSPTLFANVLLANVLQRMQKFDILPYKIQKPNPMTWGNAKSLAERRQSCFVKNGAYRPSQQKYLIDYRGEDTFGSFRKGKGGNRAIGSFESEVIRISRPYLAMPVMGYLGYPGLQLKLVDVGSGQEFEIVRRRLIQYLPKHGVWCAALYPVATIDWRRSIKTQICGFHLEHPDQLAA